jgi:hypothetical protein
MEYKNINTIGNYGEIDISTNYFVSPLISLNTIHKKTCYQLSYSLLCGLNKVEKLGLPIRYEKVSMISFCNNIEFNVYFLVYKYSEKKEIIKRNWRGYSNPPNHS